MKMFIVGVIVGLGLGIGAGSFAASRGTTPPATCGYATEGRGYSQHETYVCLMRQMGRIGNPRFEVRIVPLDLRCTAFPESRDDNIAAMFACDRLSLPSTKCTDGVFGTWSVTMSVRRYEVDSPQLCMTTKKPPFYKLTRGYTPHVFYRNP